MIERVLLPQPIESEAVTLLKKEGLDVVLSPDKKPETVAAMLKGIQAVVLRTGIVFTRELMGHADQLRVISRTGAGVDNVDLEAATEQGILVTCVPDANTYSVVEQALALMLALMKQLPRMDREVRCDNFDIRYKNLPSDLRGKTLGIVGLGRIGSELARTCHQGFNMPILAHDPYLTENLRTNYQAWISFCDMEKLFRESDIISLHIPSSSATRHLISARELAWMKPEAFIVNTSRGGILDEEALIRCLKEGIIAGAGLDVFEKEPLEKNNPLKALDNVILTPHSAALTRECVVRLALGAARAIVDVSHGRKPAGTVNPAALMHPRWQAGLSASQKGDSDETL
jgi:D-3-phosphoglycerate dehydrogenase